MELDGMPKTKFQRHYPNILEYWTDESDKINYTFDDSDEYIDSLSTFAATTITKEDKILSLLTTFTNNLFFRYNGINGAWGVPMNSDDLGYDYDNSSSKWSMGIFYFPELAAQLKIESFTQQIIKPIEVIDYPNYYTEYPHLDYDRSEIIFPAILDYILDAYYSLPPEIAKSIDSAILYTVSAVELKDYRKTLSLLSSFTSLETMVNIEYDGVKVENCKECGTPRFSVARKFREFLLKYLGDTADNKKKFNRYYTFRSKLVHTGKQLQTEPLFSEVDRDVEEEELLTRIEILQIGKLAIINWLLEYEA